MGRIIEMPLPRLGETMEEGRIGTILKKPGEVFRRGETLLEVESDKTTVEVPALQDGILLEWLVTSDQLVPVETAIARIEIEGVAVSEARQPARQQDIVSPRIQYVKDAGFAPVSRLRASTAARAEARRKGIDLAQVVGSGRNGRIMKSDLDRVARSVRTVSHVETSLGRILLRHWTSEGPEKGAVVLLHGLFADSQSFTMLARKLALRGYRVLAPDLPGHGETTCAAILPDEMARAIKASLPPVRFHLVGHSFGADVAIDLVEDALSLTLLSPAGCGEEISDDFIVAMLAGDIDHASKFLGEDLPPEARTMICEQLATHGGQLRSIVANLHAGGRQKLSILSRLSELKIPVHAVFTRDDAVIPVQHALNLPFNVSIHILQAASHLPHWRAADSIADLVTRL